MRKDTQTFLSTVLGIPLILSGVWGVNEANEASTVVFEREHVAAVTPETPQPVELPKAVPVAVPTAPVRKPEPVKVVPTAPVPPPVVTPVVAPVVEAPPAEPAPKKVVVKKSRRTRAS